MRCEKRYKKLDTLSPVRKCVWLNAHTANTIQSLYLRIPEVMSKPSARFVGVRLYLMSSV